ncbi:MAG: hypothetical protein U9Q15_04155 [Patescibacteria group bacterium]|nr:hypothetical protein [Patescibacteria group bacterium]
MQENIRFDDQKGEWISHSVAEMEAKDLSETQIKLVQDALASVQRTHDQQVSEIDTDEGHGIDQAGTLTFANKSGFGVDQKTLEEQGFHIMEEQSRLLNETLEVARQAAKDGIE